jgi:hypothetical protein
LVGSQHVGIGLDCVFDHEEIKGFIMSNPNMFPPKHGFNDVAVAQPGQFSEISHLLLSRGYSKMMLIMCLARIFYVFQKPFGDELE